MRPRTLVCLICACLVAACSTTKDRLLLAESPSVADIYQQHFSDIGLNGMQAARQALGPYHLADGDAALAGYVREAYTELELKFPRLANPTLVMFVYPRLIGPERLPVPGFSTHFPMYSRHEYALPGDAAAIKADAERLP